MVAANGRWVITFNGEIYNFLELKAQLQAAGVSFVGRTDTEVLLHAIALWGIDALPRLDGMFAFAAFDRATGELLMARDPFGEKPLYYAELPEGGLAFASELQPLELVPGIDLTISADAVAELLMFQYIGAPRTIYSAVKKLPPGHWLVARPGEAPRIGRYFEFRPGQVGFDPRPIGELADELEDILTRSLRRRLISDVPLGAFLSGGVDSSTVCALIRRRLDVPLKTFSIGFGGAPESEHETARAFAKHLGCEHHEQIIAPDTSRFLLDIGKVLDEPNADSSCLPTFLLSRFARESVTVALSGDGGDEMFTGYGRYFATLDDERRHASDPQWRAGATYYSNRILVSVEQHIEELFGGVPEGARQHLERLRATVDAGHPLFCALRASDVENYMPGAVLPKVDRMSMQHSLEVRTPFLNVELARFAERLPLGVMYEGGMGKKVLREIAYRYLPRTLIDLPKQGFGLPMSKWGRESLLEVCAQLVEGDDSRLRAAFGSRAIGRFMARQRDADGFSTYQVWTLAMLESWLRHHPAQLSADALSLVPSEPAALAATRSPEAAPAQMLAVSPLMLWRVAPRAIVVIEDSAIRLDRAAGAASVTLLATVVQLMHAAGVICDASFNASPLRVDSWRELASPGCPRDVRRAIDGAVLILPQTALPGLLSFDEFEQLRAHGVARMVAMHPYPRGDAFAFMLDLRRRSAWRDFLSVRRLAKRAIARDKLSAARPSEGELCVAGPLPGVPADETEMSDRYMLFDGHRQLPPVPALHADIAQLGGGRYSFWNRHAYFSRLGTPLDAVWAVELNDESSAILPYVPRVVRRTSPMQQQDFIGDLSNFVDSQAGLASDDHSFALNPGDRIVVLTHALPPGGAERQWCYLAIELHRRGYDVQFVTLFPLDGENLHYQPLLQSAGVPVLRLDEQPPLEVLRRLPADERRRSLAVHPANPFDSRLAQLTAVLRRLQPKAVLAQLDYSNLIAGTAALLADVPRVLLSFRNYNPTNFSYLTNEWFLPLYRALCRAPQVILSGNSHAANADYARWIGVEATRIGLVPNAIDAGRFAPSSDGRLRELRHEFKIDASTPVVLGVFRLSEEKRPLLFVEACAQAAEKVSGLRVLVAGVGPFESAMRRRIEELGLQEAVTLLGRRDDIADLMAISSVLLLTSSFEGMPNVVMEAQVCGLPVVASRVGGVPDCMIDGETGYIVDVDDYVGFGKRCVQILSLPDLRDRLGRRGMQHMREEFSIAAMSDRYLQLLTHGCAQEQSGMSPATLPIAA
jgi:asparagine synthase (glutamine-hydrolysing)